MIAEAVFASTLPISRGGMDRLREYHLTKQPKPAPAKKPLIDHHDLAACYRKMLHDGGFSCQADLARHLGVSRVWVSRVLKGIKRRAG